jgi:mannose-6-phosphate isomerase-like protein (cupin superfamily)
MANELFAYAKDMKKIVHKTHGRHSNLLVTKEDMGADGFILGCHTMDPGGYSPEHIHANEAEAMFFYEGTGTARVGGEEFEIIPETVVLSPAGVGHSVRNTGDGPLKFVFVYCPPLPEHISREEYFKRAKDQIGSA